MEIRNVLMVDDDDAIRRVAEIGLSRIGLWNVIAVSSGQKALTTLETYSPDLILLDVMMPGLDGPGTFKLLRSNEHTKNIPVIFMTAKVQKHEVQAYYDFGVSGVITKPFDPLSLPFQIRQILNEHLKMCVA